MRTVKFEFQVTQAEYELLVLANGERNQAKPRDAVEVRQNERLKLLLLADASKTLKRMADDVMQAYWENRKYRGEFREQQIQDARKVFANADAHIVFPVVKGKTMPGKVVKRNESA